jgi:hypothetical protein
MKTYGGVEAYLNTFLILALDYSGQLHAQPVLPQGKEPPVPPDSGRYGEEKNLCGELNLGSSDVSSIVSISAELSVLCLFAQL